MSDIPRKVVYIVLWYGLIITLRWKESYDCNEKYMRKKKLVSYRHTGDDKTTLRTEQRKVILSYFFDPESPCIGAQGCSAYRNALEHSRRPQYRCDDVVRRLCPFSGLGTASNLTQFRLVGESPR